MNMTLLPILVRCESTCDWEYLVRDSVSFGEKRLWGVLDSRVRVRVRVRVELGLGLGLWSS